MTGKTKLSNKPFCRICSCLKTVLTLKNSKINRMKRNLQSSFSKDNSHLQSKARLLNLTKYCHFLQEIYNRPNFSGAEVSKSSSGKPNARHMRRNDLSAVGIRISKPYFGCMETTS